VSATYRDFILETRTPEKQTRLGHGDRVARFRDRSKGERVAIMATEALCSSRFDSKIVRRQTAFLPDSPKCRKNLRQRSP
jgi:hypothetical protein